MKKKLFAGLLASATVLGMFVAGGTVLAAEVDSGETGVGIGFGAHTPGKTPGPLQIKWVPGELNFGEDNKVNTALANFPEKGEAGGAKKYAVVEDSRAHGLGDPAVEWKLTAEVEELVSTTNPMTKLTGAVLNFDDAGIQGYEGTVSPEISGIVAKTTQSAITQSSYNLITGAGTATEIMKDGDTSGTTSFEGNTAMEMKNITLTVPKNIAQTGHKYTGKMTWSLDDTI